MLSRRTSNSTLDENIDSEDSAMEESSQDEGEDGDKMETAEKTEEVGNLQLAWETLELELELEAKMCDAYLCLGEVSIENEKYSQAATDLTVCLEKRKTTLPSDSRYGIWMDCDDQTAYYMITLMNFMLAGRSPRRGTSSASPRRTTPSGRRRRPALTTPSASWRKG